MVKPPAKKAAAGGRTRVRAELVPPPARAQAAPSSIALARREPDDGALVRQPSSQKRSARLLQAFFAKRSELTVRNYRVDLVHFGRWWRAEGSDLDRLNARRGTVMLDLDMIEVPESADGRDEFVAQVLREFHTLDQLEALATVLVYQKDLKEGTLGRPFAAQTINHRITAIRAVTGMAKLLGMCSFELGDVDLLPVTLSRSTEGCGEDGYATLTALADKDVKATEGEDRETRLRATRNAVLLHLMHDSGLRRFEVIQPRWPIDVDLRAGRLSIRRKKRADREWFNGVNATGIAAIERHLQVRGREPGYLLHGRDPSRSLNERTVNRILEELAKRAGVEVTPHGLRHTSATTLLERTGGNVRAVAEFLGHKNTATVQIYDDDRKKLAQQMSNLLDTKPTAPRKGRRP